ncbi:hypothetical protein LguiB_001669 [Lonicera macranthoides]
MCLRYICIFRLIVSLVNRRSPHPSHLSLRSPSPLIAIHTALSPSSPPLAVHTASSPSSPLLAKIGHPRVFSLARWLQEEIKRDSARLTQLEIERHMRLNKAPKKNFKSQPRKVKFEDE